MRFTILAAAVVWAGTCGASYLMSPASGAPTAGVAALVDGILTGRRDDGAGCRPLLVDLAAAQIRRDGAYEQLSRPLHMRRVREGLEAYLRADCPLGPALAVRAAAHDEAAAWRAGVGLPAIGLDPFPRRAQP
ncbi:hypothetical protein PQI07_27115 [Methylobacterium sp. 092160098-2]|uniref:hypothetical protein n=1 Tax=Methylobacterium sp. 092160098-2 TaxID=3025129 RepID=UPI002381B547|nr:hypothetical protein [Methylobacterium sp. 092160098-2]MDE4914345.1 hypothetical protein [Methylobacterium sp. 092160098-2]